MFARCRLIGAQNTPRWAQPLGEPAVDATTSPPGRAPPEKNDAITGVFAQRGHELVLDEHGAAVGVALRFNLGLDSIYAGLARLVGSFGRLRAGGSLAWFELLGQLR
jgi:hypothetical protein